MRTFTTVKLLACTFLLAGAAGRLFVNDEPSPPSPAEAHDRLRDSQLLGDVPGQAPKELNAARARIQRTGSELFALERGSALAFGAPLALDANEWSELSSGLEDRKELVLRLLEDLESPAVVTTLEHLPHTGPSPRLAGTRAAANTLCARAWVAAMRDGDSHEAARSLRLILDLALVVDGGDVTSHMIRAAVESVAFETLARLSSHESVDVEVLARALEPAIARLEAPGRWRASLASAAASCAGASWSEYTNAGEVDHHPFQETERTAQHLRAILDQWERLENVEDDGQALQLLTAASDPVLSAMANCELSRRERLSRARAQLEGAL